MPEAASESNPTSVARFNHAGRKQPRMGADGRGDNVGAVKPRIGRKGYVRFLGLKDLDGRSRAAQRTRQIVAAIENDLGGGDRLSEAQRQLVQRAAFLSVQCED
jgi:hypothetical protein